MKILASLLLATLALSACTQTTDRGWRKQAEMMDTAVPR